jgi:hypothetical protein
MIHFKTVVLSERTRRRRASHPVPGERLRWYQGLVSCSGVVGAGGMMVWVSVWVCVASLDSSWRAEREAEEEEEEEEEVVVLVRVGWGCPANALSFSSVRLILFSSVSGTFIFPPSSPSSAKRVKPPFFFRALLLMLVVGCWSWY